MDKDLIDSNYFARHNSIIWHNAPIVEYVVELVKIQKSQKAIATFKLKQRAAALSPILSDEEVYNSEQPT